MDPQLYRDITNFISSYRGTSRVCFKVLKTLYPEIPSFTLGSICSLHYQYKMMSNHHKLKAKAKMLYKSFTDAVIEGQSPGIIIRIAQKTDICPALIARSILEQYGLQNKLSDTSGGPKKSIITSMMRDTASIEDRDLALEIYLSIIHDDQYGPIADSIKHCIGEEHEDLLKAKLQHLGLAFRDEKILRARGYDKTPDVKLEIPVALDGFIINWIESKALFADQKTHLQYLKSQYDSYWNRFGSGLVIYWFGYTAQVEDPSEKRFIVRNHFPTNLTFINPGLVPAPSLI